MKSTFSVLGPDEAPLGDKGVKILEDAPRLEIVQAVGDVFKSVCSTLVVVPPVGGVDAMAGVQIPESLKGRVIVAEQFDEYL